MAIKKSLMMCILLTLCIFSASGTTWKFFFYMDASDNLTDMAFKNITDMIRGQPNGNVEVLIQLHAYEHTAPRYKVTNMGLHFVDEVQLSGDSKQDFIAAATWAFLNNKSDHTVLVFSNHGWGALDPRWNPVEHAWQAAEMSIPKDDGLNTSCTLPDKAAQLMKSMHRQHKGFVFNDRTHTYLTNTDLAFALSYVKHALLNGKNIDAVVFDTCMGSVLEIATCCAPAADYLVGVQSCALRDGFNYQEFIAALNKGNSPSAAAVELVAAFDAYYATHDEVGIYTCAALDLSRVDPVNHALNSVANTFLQHPEWTSFFKQARDQVHDSVYGPFTVTW